MAGPLSNFAAGIQDSAGTRAVAVISINGRARGPQGAVGLLTDVVVFPPPPLPAIQQLGRWIVGNQRVRVMGVPTIGQSAVGMIDYIYPPPIPPPIVPQPDLSPMTVVQGSPRARAF